MRKYFALLAVVLLIGVTATAFAKDNLSGPVPVSLDPAIAGGSDVPARAPDGFARADTINFGYYQYIGGEIYAVQGEMWTFDHGGDPFEGWTDRDLTANPYVAFRRITAAIWNADPDNPPTAPIIAGTGSVWCGLFEGEADDLCWDAGLGYGNSWCQRLTSPTLTYDGSGSVSMAMSYFNDTELNYDYSKVILRVGAETVNLNGAGFTDKIGTPPSGPWAAYNRDISNADFGGGTQSRDFQIVFQMESDGGWSDEDGDYTTEYGPFGADNITLTNNIVQGNQNYTYEVDLQGWTAGTCPAIGSFFGVADVANYIILDPCQCELDGNVLEMHDVNFEHPEGQHIYTISPPADRTNLQSYNEIFADWDQYAEMPQANGVFYRSGWLYYPYLCPATGENQWSPRSGIGTFYYAGDQPACYGSRNVATDWGVPADVDLIGFIYEIYASCDAFGIPPTICTGVTNFTPIIDNIQIRMTGVPNAPTVTYPPGGQYQDGFGQTSLVLNPADVGNADCVYDLRGLELPDKLGDSLNITGPVPSPSTRWLSRLWFRVTREGPSQAANGGYQTWKTRVSDGLNIVGPNAAFTYGWMDSCEVGTQIARNKFCSQFHEMDDDFVPGQEQEESNEIIMDGILTPGTKIDYFVTAAYTCTPTEMYLLPDTSGAFYSEFEMLPSMRLDGGSVKFPCVLYVDAYNRGSQFYIENALNVVLNGAGSGAPIPDPTTWDRYDYLDASSNWKAPMFRNIGGNAGATLPQLLGYKMMLVNNGALSAGCMEDRDWQGFGDWLSAVACDANTNTQGLIVNGDNIAQVIDLDYSSFLSTYLGAFFNCDGYNQDGCPSGETENDEQYCVRLNAAPGGPFAPAIPVDAFGNWCPPQFLFDVVGTTGGGVGNRAYNKIGTAVNANYAQVTKDASGAGGNYRTVLDGVSYHHLAKRDLANPGPDSECPNDSASIVEASYNEIREAIKWTLGIANPTQLGLCIDPCGGGVNVPEDGNAEGAMVNRLYQNHPNPFNPRTAIKFSLANDGPAKLVIFDVNGRKVRTLVEGHQVAGTHEVVWDGTDDSGHQVASGVFWSQLSTEDGYSSNKKMVVLK